MQEIKLDDKNRLYPHPKVLEAFADEKRGNGYQRERTPDDDRYDSFVAACKKNPFNCHANKIIRSRSIIKGKLTEIIYWYANIYGTDASGKERMYEHWFGVYDEPLFDRQLDKETDQYIAVGVRDHLRRYEYEFNDKNMEEVFQYADDGTVLLVKESPEMALGDQILDRDGFKSANFLQLVEMGKKKRTLKEIIELASQTIAIKEKHETETEKQAEIAEDIGEPKSADEVLEAGGISSGVSIQVEEQIEAKDEVKATKVKRKNK